MHSMAHNRSAPLPKGLKLSAWLIWREELVSPLILQAVGFFVSLKHWRVGVGGGWWSVFHPPVVALLSLNLDKSNFEKG